ncbi:hypothetical protein [Microvirga calopogonii]|uniref:hypothetical protein n=1 Tax=Microvirga calopogonii TaxID=2078013 RepID=UPI0013B43A21|nr:hypothetical protein [Microvirga calopogonii]
MADTAVAADARTDKVPTDVAGIFEHILTASEENALRLPGDLGQFGNTYAMFPASGKIDAGRASA